MVIDVTSIEGRVDQHTLLKEDMNHKTNVNTTPIDTQANVVNTTLPLSQIKLHMEALDAQALDIRTLTDICVETIDTVPTDDPAAQQAVQRLDTLLKGIWYCAEVQRQANEQMMVALEGGAQ